MTIFEDRERGYEAKFAHDEENRFRIAARRDKLFARWAAERLQIMAADADALMAAVLHIPDGPGHEQALIAHIADSLAKHGHALTRPELAAALAACAEQARTQVTESPHLPADAP